MTYRVHIEPAALADLSRLMDADRGGALELFEFIDSLAGNPRPPEAAVWGPEYRRARVGNWRVLYRIDDAVEIVAVENVGRTDTNGGKQ